MFRPNTIIGGSCLALGVSTGSILRSPPCARNAILDRGKLSDANSICGTSRYIDTTAITIGAINVTNEPSSALSFPGSLDGDKEQPNRALEGLAEPRVLEGAEASALLRAALRRLEFTRKERRGFEFAINGAS
ncbi:hypothetical protein KM043_005662 [Ampulex compressa]|nr:hypothetical protein KM043_005662 [Ampulex compressa]